jgi:sugar lactone lactonase YvrE
MNELSPRRVSEALYDLGEGARWDDVQREICWVDITRGLFLRGREISNGDVDVFASYDIEETVGAFAPFRDRSLGWLIAGANSLLRIDPSGFAEEILALDDVTRGCRLNDGACDPWGRFIVGSMSFDEVSPLAKLFSYDGTNLRTLVDGVTISNGLGWSPDTRTMYYIDTVSRSLFAYDTDPSGEIRDQRTLFTRDASEGFPDGLCVDAEGGIWVAFWDGHSVERFSPKGELLSKISMPVSRPTSCAIGGESGTTLFITTAKTGLSEEVLSREPDSGALFRVEVGVPGLALAGFGS